MEDKIHATSGTMVNFRGKFSRNLSKYKIWYATLSLSYVNFVP